MNFIIEENRIYLPDEEGKVVAEITFQEIEKGIFNIDHTFVDEKLRGKGIASKLVAKATEIIKLKGGKVQATCSYAKSWLESHNVKLF